VLLRELTKTFEQIHAAPLARMQPWLAADADHRRGEFVIVLAGAEAESSDVEAQREVLGVLLDYMRVKDAAAAAARLTGASKRDLYQLALTLKG